MKKLFTVVVLTLAFNQQLFAETKVAQEIVASRPAQEGCIWKKLDSQKPIFSVLYQDCDFGFRRITHSFKGDSFLEKLSDTGDSAPDTLIQIFQKNADQQPAEVLKKQFIDKLSAYEKAHCVAKESKDKDLLESPFTSPNKHVWVIEPDHEYAEKIEKETPEGDMPENSCGDYGLPVDS